MIILCLISKRKNSTIFSSKFFLIYLSITSDKWKTIQIWIQFFCVIKGSEIVFIFLPLLSLIMWLKTSQKNFEKMSIFEVWLAVFLQRRQNSLRLNTSEMMHFQKGFLQILPSNRELSTLHCIWRILQPFLSTLTYKKGNICFHELMFYRPTD